MNVFGINCDVVLFCSVETRSKFMMVNEFEFFSYPLLVSAFLMFELALVM